MATSITGPGPGPGAAPAPRHRDFRGLAERLRPLVPPRACTSFALPLADLALLAAAALAIETRTQQRRGIGAQLRGGG